MKHFDFSKAAGCLLAMAGLTLVSAEAAPYAVGSDSRIARQEQNVMRGRRYDAGNIFSAADPRLNTDRTKDQTSPTGIRRVAVNQPDLSYDNLPSFGYLQGTDGNMWFYTSRYEYEEREIVIDSDLSYTEDVISAFTFTIYDSTFTEIGKISDEVRYEEGETRVVEVLPDPLLTRNFFNEDGNIEVMVYHAMNTTEFVNRYYYNVYSLGGETDGNGRNKVVATLDGRIFDVTNASGDPGVEDYYFTFGTSPICADLDAEYPDYMDYLNSLVYRMTVFGKAVDDSGMRELFTKDVYCSRAPGDTTEGSYLITKTHGGKIYYIFSQYEKPYFVDPTGMAQDESATPDNSLTIEVVSVENGEPRQVSFTSIPVPEYNEEGQLIYTFLSIGSVSWAGDIDMVVNGTPESPAFIVCVDVQNAAEYEDYILSGYYIYGADGNIIKELAGATNGMVLFYDGDNEPQAMYTVRRNDGGYDFKFGGLYTGGIDFTIDQYNGGDPISASCDRVKQKDGSYRYAFEMTYYDSDEEGNDYIRVAWYNGDGTFDRIDRINMGPNVMAGAVNMAASVLRPDLFDTDDAMEYAVMVKRSNGGSGNTTLGMATEFMIVDDNGETYAHFTDEDGKGDPYSFTIAFGEPNKLMMIYNNNYRYNIDVYELPFLDNAGPGQSGIQDAVASEGGAIRYDGTSVYADGALVEVYSTLGVRMAAGKGSVNVSTLGAGTYVVVATDSAGRKSAVKIAR